MHRTKYRTKFRVTGTLTFSFLRIVARGRRRKECQVDEETAINAGEKIVKYLTTRIKTDTNLPPSAKKWNLVPWSLVN